MDQTEFSWGEEVKGTEDRGIKYYSSFQLNGVRYGLFDTVYLNPLEGLPYIGRIVELSETLKIKEGKINKQTTMLVRWFCRPCELPENLEVDYSPESKEVFIMYGNGSQKPVNPASVLKHCKVLCTSDDDWNTKKPSTDEVAAADYVFDRAVGGSGKLLPLKFVVSKCGVRAVTGHRGDSNSSACNGHVGAADRRLLEPEGKWESTSEGRDSELKPRFAKGFPSSSRRAPSDSQQGFERSRVPGSRLSNIDTDVQAAGIRASVSSSFIGQKTVKNRLHSSYEKCQSLRASEHNCTKIGQVDNKRSLVKSFERDRFSELQKRQGLVGETSIPAVSMKKGPAVDSDRGTDEGRAKRLKIGDRSPVHENNPTSSFPDTAMRRSLEPGNTGMRQQNHSREAGQGNREFSSSPSRIFSNDNLLDRGAPHSDHAQHPVKRHRLEALKSSSAIQLPAGPHVTKKRCFIVEDLEDENPLEFPERSTEPNPDTGRLDKSPAVEEGDLEWQSPVCEQVLPSEYPQVQNENLRAGRKREIDAARYTVPGESKPLFPSKQHESPLPSKKTGEFPLKPEACKLAPLQVGRNIQEVVVTKKHDMLSSKSQSTSSLGLSPSKRGTGKTVPTVPSTSLIDRAGAELRLQDLPGASSMPRGRNQWLPNAPDTSADDLADYKRRLYEPSSKIFGFPNDSVQSALKEKKALLLYNLDPLFSSAEVEAILRVSMSVICEARMLQPINCATYTTGRALLLFKSHQTASDTLDYFQKNWVIWTVATRPVLARFASEDTGRTEPVLGFQDVKMFMTLAVEKKDHDNQGIAHMSQPNTVEFEMGSHWRYLTTLAQKKWENLEKDYASMDQAIDSMRKDDGQAPHTKENGTKCRK